MRKYVFLCAAALVVLIAWLPSTTIASVIQAIIPAAVPTANKQGNSTKFQLGTGSPGAGDCAEFDGGGNVAPTGSPCGVGGAGTPGSTVFSSTSSAGPNNTAAETSLVGTVIGSATIAANVFGDGEVLEARAQGFYSLPAVADSLTLKMKCGSTVLGSASTTLPAGVLTNGTFRFWLMITARGTGAGGTLITNGVVEFSGNPSALAPSELKVLNTSAVAFNFTTSCAFDITAQWGAAQVGELLTATNAAAWFPGAPVTSVFAGARTGAAVPSVDDISAPQFCQAAGASTTDYTCSLPATVPVAYVTGTRYRFKADVANTAAGGKPTIAFNGLAAKQIVKVQGGITTALAADDIRAGQWVDLTYDGTNMQMESQLGNAPASGVTSVGGVTGAVPGGTILIEQHSATSSAELDFTTCITSTYDVYQIVAVSLIPATNNVNLLMQLSTDGGGTYDATSGHYFQGRVFQGMDIGGTSGDRSTTLTGWDLRDAGNTASHGGSAGTFYLNNPLSGATFPWIHGTYTANNSADNFYTVLFGGSYQQTTAVNAFRFKYATGNIASGTVRCYGVAKQ